MSQIHLVLADDDPDDCFIFTQVATEVLPQVKITCMHDCESLLKLLKESPLPDVIFLDLNMPIIGGIQCLETIKENPQWRDVPIVIYSTASREEIVTKCYEAGANLYIVKPSNTEKLKERIISVIEKFTTMRLN